VDVFGDWGRNYIEGMAGLWCTITATTSWSRRQQSATPPRGGLTNMLERIHGLGYADSPTASVPW